MTACSAKHPEHPGLLCLLPRTVNSHPEHLAMRYVMGQSQPEQLTWPDPEYRSPLARTEQARTVKATIEKDAAEVRAEIRAATPQTPIGTGTRKKTRLGMVAQLFVNNVGVWIPGHRFVDQNTGGTAGLRRVKALQNEHGWHIEQRPVPGTTDDYRLVELPDEFKNAQ